MKGRRERLLSAKGQLRLVFHARALHEIAKDLAADGAPLEVLEALWTASGWLSATALWVAKKREESRRREKEVLDGEGVDRG